MQNLSNHNTRVEAGLASVAKRGLGQVSKRKSVLQAGAYIAGFAVSGFASAADVPGVKQKEPAPPASIWEQSTLTGDWGGARTALSDRGIDLSINYIGETLSNVTGGLKTGTQYQGRLELTVETDFQKMLNWAGLTGHVTVYQIHDINGRIGPDFVGSIGDPSNIDAFPTTRLFTAWLQQNFWDDKVSLRLGQLAADDEFLTSATAGGLIGGTFGWANFMAANLPSGGPAYPLATPGARIAIKATENLLFQAAIFSGDPAGKNCNDDPQVCDRHGLEFSFTGGTFSIAELQYNVNQGKEDTGLAASYKVGGWYHSGKFADQRYGLDAAGAVVPLADPTVVGPLFRNGESGIYGVIDQMFWRTGPKSASFFLRAAATQSNVNLVSYYIDGGVGVKAPFAGRDDDTLIFGFAYSNISSAARGADLDIVAFSGGTYPIRDYELQFEVSYVAQIAPWWTIQPDFQYIVHPGGNVPNRNVVGQTIHDAVVVGVRSSLKF
jgi:porin